MSLKLKDKWVWDSWYVHDGNQWHVQFLQANKSLGDPELRHFNASQGHATSQDLINWDYLGTALAPSVDDNFDNRAVWTGSIVRGDNDIWHLFYTGVSDRDEGMYQRIGHATSKDLHSWERVDDGMCLDLIGPAATYYEADHAVGFWHDRAMRDPWVIPDPQGSGWLMYFTARFTGESEPNAGGAIGFATSPDLMNWTLQPPVFRGGFGQLEVPQVFNIGDRWYCLFCTAAEHWSAEYTAQYDGEAVTGSHYLVATNPRGPWKIAPGPFLDGAMPCKRYASRIVEIDGELKILGFADGGAASFGGYIMDPETVNVNPDGTLTIAPSQA